MKKIKMKIGKTYTPKKPISSDNEIIGDHWRAWTTGKGFFCEYDAGHFATKLKVIDISKDDFILIKSGKISISELIKKYE